LFNAIENVEQNKSPEFYRILNIFLSLWPQSVKISH